MRANLGSWVGRMGTAAGRQLRALMPSMSPGVIFRMLLGVLLFLCGIIFGVWLIIRSRRQDPGL
jgi:hypothetical protein